MSTFTEGSWQTAAPLAASGLVAGPKGASDRPVPAGIPSSTCQLVVSESFQSRPERRHQEVREEGEAPASQGCGTEVHDLREHQHKDPHSPQMHVLEHGRAAWGQVEQGDSYVD